MSGWIDWYAEETECPFCKDIVKIIFWEEGSANPYTPTITGIAEGQIECPHCNNIITDQSLDEEKMKQSNEVEADEENMELMTVEEYEDDYELDSPELISCPYCKGAILYVHGGATECQYCHIILSDADVAIDMG